MDQGLDKFHSNSALNNIIFKETYPLKFLKISHILSSKNGLKSVGKSGVIISHIFEVIEGLD